MVKMIRDNTGRFAERPFYASGISTMNASG
jgi:hypothetical protein